jgi:hypothetical protein
MCEVGNMRKASDDREGLRRRLLRPARPGTENIPVAPYGY